MSRSKFNRRQFVAAATGAVIAAPSVLHAQNPNNRLNIAIIGCGGRGAANLSAVSAENIVASCDVNQRAIDAAAGKEVTGEIVDLMCYVDHKATGDKHAVCGNKCIKGGGPVGIVSDGKAYLVVGEHKPINDTLADSCGKTITLKGKVAERDGMTMLENAEIVKK